MLKFLSKVIYNIKKRGLFSLTFNICYRLIRKIIPIEYLFFYEQELQQVVIKHHPLIDVKFEKAKLNDIDKLDYNEYNLLGINKTDLCYVGSTDKIVAYIWISYSSICYDKLFNINLKKNQAYIYKAFTHPAYRGLNIYPALLNKVCLELSKEKIEKCYIATTPDNLSSKRGISKVGFKKVGSIWFFKIDKLKKAIMLKKLQPLTSL